MQARKASGRWSRERVERGIYRQPNGKYAVCFMRAGRPRFRTVAGDLDAARRERELLIAAAGSGAVAVSPRLRFATVAGRWLERFEARVIAGERRERTLEAHRYHVTKHLLPALASRRMRAIGVGDVAELLTGLRAAGRSEKTVAEALSALHSIVRFAIRNGWIADNPVSKLEADERPHPTGRRQRVLGRDEIGRLLAGCRPRYRPLIATALNSRGARPLAEREHSRGTLRIAARCDGDRRPATSSRAGDRTAAPLEPPRDRGGDAGSRRARRPSTASQRLGARRRKPSRGKHRLPSCGILGAGD